MLLLPVAIFSFWLAFNRSYHVLWYQTHRLFDILPSASLVLNNRTQKSLISIVDSNDSFLQKFHSEYSISSKKVYNVVRIIFSASLASYVVAIEIVLWQIKAADSDTEANTVTMFIWPILLIVLGVSLILLQPFLILLFLLNKFFEDKMSIDKLAFITSGITAIWLILLHFLKVGPFGYTTNFLTKVSIVGVTIMGILSGLASVSTPYYTLKFFLNRNNTGSKLTAHNKIETLWANDSNIWERIRDYESQVEQNLSLLNKANPSSSSTNSVMKEQLQEKIGWYQLEILKLRGKLNDSKEMRIAKKMFQFIFLLYCVYKLINVLLIQMPKIVVHSLRYPNDFEYKSYDDGGSDKDPLAVTISNILDFFLFRFNYQQELDSLTKQISLVLSICLFVCSLSTVSTTISYLLTLLPVRLQVLALSALQNKDNSELPKSKQDIYLVRKTASIIKNLAVSELTGVYILATILMIRSNLPYEVSQRVNELLGERFTVPNVVIDIWSDKIFALSALFTIVGIKIAERTLTK